MASKKLQNNKWEGCVKDLNTVALCGRITADSKLQTFGDWSVASFSIAVNRRTKENGEWKDKASFFRVRLGGKSAENLNSYLVKGKMVAIQGGLVQETWEKDGKKNEKVYIQADDVILLGGGQEKKEATQSDIKPVVNFDDDIPF